MNRRDALGLVGLASLAALAPSAFAQSEPTRGGEGGKGGAQGDTKPGPAVAASAILSNPISLAQWSLHRRFGLGKPEERAKNPADPMDFARIAKEEFGIVRLELVNQFYARRIGEKSLGGEFRKRCDDLGVRCELIMCDGEGLCGATDEKARAQFAANHEKWIAFAKEIGCHAIRVNAIGEGNADEQKIRCADGLVKLLAIAKPAGINVIVENHGGLSSDGAWLVDVMKLVADRDACGTLPDFGNWRDGSGTLIDPVRNVGLVVPYAKGMSAKSYDFDANGNETLLDYPAILDVVAKSGYKGAIGIEYEGKRMSEHDGILATKAILERFGCRA
ncbi:MAG: sugar phosphate isomerase/epimerase [Planctomycetaceae bacterium]|nr:sugar phosphate isomerase/epimerase [Planctomycetaceae bacterium]